MDNWNIDTWKIINLIYPNWSGELTCVNNVESHEPKDIWPLAANFLENRLAVQLRASDEQFRHTYLCSSNFQAIVIQYYRQVNPLILRNF